MGQSTSLLGGQTSSQIGSDYAPIVLETLTTDNNNNCHALKLRQNGSTIGDFSFR